jgi:hypothetical protein
MFTRLEKTPREYSLNYCYSDIEAHRTALNKETWIVFSDREGNYTYQNPGGKVKMKKMGFMESFFVIKEKGDYLRLVKYDPEIVEKNPHARKLKDRKKAEYYGWVHRSRMLLTRQSGTDPATGFKFKAFSIISDSSAVVVSDPVFEKDSIITYKDDKLLMKHGRLPVHEILYILKPSTDNQKLLVSRKTVLSPLGAPTEVLGWVSSSVIKEAGQRLFVDIESITSDSLSAPLLFMDKTGKSALEISKKTSDRIKDYITLNPALRYSPVRSYTRNAGIICFNTSLPAPVIDKSFNYVLNVNGNKIMYEDFKELEKEMRKMNLIFIFEGKEQTLNHFPEIVNVIQNLQILFENPKDDFRYKFGAVMAYPQKNKEAPTIKSLGLTDSYADIMDFLMAEKDSTSRYNALSNEYAWHGLRKAVDLAESYSKENNLLVIIGESGYSEWADSVLVRRMANANCKILGYQIHSETTNSANNFVLQVEDMINNYARHQFVLKKERIVYADQVKPTHRYRERLRNVYSLDYPGKSMTQGWILFPDKKENLSMNVLSLSIDSLVMEVKADNDTLIGRLYKAFYEVGNNRYHYDSLWIKYNNRDTSWPLNQATAKKFTREYPAWYMPSLPVYIDSTDANLDYHLLLSASELNELMTFMELIIRFEPDYKYKRGKRKKADLCNCPDDESFTGEIRQPDEIMTDENGYPVYLSTRKIRRHLYKSFLSELKAVNKLCKTKKRRMKYFSLAQAGMEIIGNPVKTEMMNVYQIRDIKRKQGMTDYELDNLILYFKDKKEKLDEHLRTSGNTAFLSNGEPYYWLNREMLP